MQAINCSVCRLYQPRLGSVGGSKGRPRICARCADKGKNIVSIFFVFGMTRPAARELAAKHLPRPSPTPDKESEAEKMVRYQQELDTEAQQIFDGFKIVRCSEGFATPEFAMTFIKLAKKEGARDLHIRCRKISTAADGQHATTDRGRPRTEWITWTQ